MAEGNWQIIASNNSIGLIIFAPVTTVTVAYHQPEPEKLAHDFTDTRGTEEFCKACGLHYLTGSEMCSGPLDDVTRNLRIESWIEGAMNEPMLPIYQWWEMSPERWTAIGIGPRAPYHVQHTRDLSLMGGWDRREPWPGPR